MLYVKTGVGPSSIILQLSEDFNFLELVTGGEVVERIGLDTIDDIRMGMGCMSNIVESGVDPLKSLHIRGEYWGYELGIPWMPHAYLSNPTFVGIRICGIRKVKPSFAYRNCQIG